MEVLRQVGHSANGSSSTLDHQIKIYSSLTINIIFEVCSEPRTQVTHAVKPR